MYSSTSFFFLFRDAALSSTTESECDLSEQVVDSSYIRVESRNPRKVPKYKGRRGSLAEEQHEEGGDTTEDENNPVSL